MRKLLLLVLVSAFCVTVSSARAATVDANKNLTFRLGTFQPTDGSTKDFLGSSWLEASLGYAIRNTGTSVELGWTQSQGRSHQAFMGEAFVSFDAKASIMALTLSSKSKSRRSGLYYGWGVGPCFCRVNVPASASGQAGTLSLNVSDSKTVFGSHVFAGWRFSETLGLEARWSRLGSINLELMGTPVGPIELSGFSLCLEGTF